MIDRQGAKVGCCGFATRQREYYRLFRVVELQSTFYQLPRTETAERWRSEAPSDFNFCLKAWQVITHPATSPTWSRMSKGNLPPNSAKYGHLRPTRENFSAWENILQICNSLEASVCLIQCPPSFRFSRRNADNVRRFLGQIDRGGTKLAWEPRGNWREHLEEIKKLCRQVDLIHAVDILRSGPAVESETCYFRLHGLGPRELNYKYDYSAEDLRRLRRVVIETLNKGVEEAFILFNNISMLEDARAFDKMLRADHSTDSSAEQVLPRRPHQLPRASTRSTMRISSYDDDRNTI